MARPASRCRGGAGGSDPWAAGWAGRRRGRRVASPARPPAGPLSAVPGPDSGQRHRIGAGPYVADQFVHDEQQDQRQRDQGQVGHELADEGIDVQRHPVGRAVRRAGPERDPGGQGRDPRHHADQHDVEGEHAEGERDERAEDPEGAPGPAARHRGGQHQQRCEKDGAEGEVRHDPHPGQVAERLGVRRLRGGEPAGEADGGGAEPEQHQRHGGRPMLDDGEDERREQDQPAEGQCDVAGHDGPADPDLVPAREDGVRQRQRDEGQPGREVQVAQVEGVALAVPEVPVGEADAAPGRRRRPPGGLRPSNGLRSRIGLRLSVRLSGGLRWPGSSGGLRGPGGRVAGRRRRSGPGSGRLVAADAAQRQDRQQGEQGERQQRAGQDPPTGIPGQRRGVQQPDGPGAVGAGGLPAALVAEQFHPGQRGDQQQVQGEAEGGPADRRPVQPEPDGTGVGARTAHPARHVRQREREEQQPQHPRPAAGGQSTPGVRLDVPAGRVRRPVEAGDPVPGDVLRRRVTEQVLGCGATDSVQPEFGDAAEVDGRRYQPGRAGDRGCAVTLQRHDVPPGSVGSAAAGAPVPGEPGRWASGAPERVGLVVTTLPGVVRACCRNVDIDRRPGRRKRRFRRIG